jgi:AcrR family transcriptional regulator
MSPPHLHLNAGSSAAPYSGNPSHTALLASARDLLEKELPWRALRMGDAARHAGLSRQTLHNEFGSKNGLAAALSEYEISALLSDVNHALATALHRGLDLYFEALATQIERTARKHTLTRYLLTGQQTNDQFTGFPVPADAGPARIVERLCDLAADRLDRHAAPRCETVIRLALSYVVAPTVNGASGDGIIGPLVHNPPRTTLGPRSTSGPARTAPCPSCHPQPAPHHPEGAPHGSGVDGSTDTQNASIDSTVP